MVSVIPFSKWNRECVFVTLPHSKMKVKWCCLVSTPGFSNISHTEWFSHSGGPLLRMRELSSPQGSGVISGSRYAHECYVHHITCSTTYSLCAFTGEFEACYLVVACNSIRAYKARRGIFLRARLSTYSYPFPMVGERRRGGGGSTILTRSGLLTRCFSIRACTPLSRLPQWWAVVEKRWRRSAIWYPG